MSATATAAPQRSMNPLSPFTPQQLAQSAAASRIILGLNRTDQSGVRYEPLAYSTSLTPVFGSPTTVQLQPFQAGLVQKYIVEVITTVTNPAGGSTLTRSELGPLASLSNISYTDPVQNQRINTTGWHLASVAAMRPAGCRAPRSPPIRQPGSDRTSSRSPRRHRSPPTPAARSG